MYNKRLFILLCMVLSVFFVFLGLSSSAVNLQLNLGDRWKIIDEADFNEKISTIHFKDHGNDFGGFIYFNQGTGLTLEDAVEKVSFSGDSYTGYDCAQIVEGFYYNEQRGDRLWPLDEKTANIRKMDELGLEITGAIYTRCILSGYDAELAECEDEDVYDTEDEIEQCVSDVKEKHRDTYGYYGFIEHEYSGQQMRLFLGTNYELMNNGVMSGRVVATGSLEPSLIRIGNKFPVGFIYDYNGGVGFVGCKVGDSYGISDVFGKYESKRDWNYYFNVNNGLTGVDVIDRSDGMGERVECGKIGSAKDTLLSIVVEGIVGMGKNSNTDGYVGNQGNRKMQLFSSVDVNNTTLINYAKQKAETLCRGKWNNSEGNILCIDNSGGDDDVNAYDPAYSGKTLIVKGRDVIITPNKDKVYDIFIDSGNLLIAEDVDPEHPDKQYVINSNGFIANDGNREDFLFISFVYMNKGTVPTVSIFSEANLLRINPPEGCGDGENLYCLCENLDSYQSSLCLYSDLLGNINYYLDEYDVSEILALLSRVGNYDISSSVASIIKGNFIVNGKVEGTGDVVDGKLKNKYFIYGKFTTKDSFSDLEKLFTWRCVKGTDTNGNPCLQVGTNPYSNATLSIIDQNYNSPLFK